MVCDDMCVEVLCVTFRIEHLTLSMKLSVVPIPSVYLCPSLFLPQQLAGFEIRAVLLGPGVRSYVAELPADL